jgi:hypothetical protein
MERLDPTVDSLEVVEVEAACRPDGGYAQKGEEVSGVGPAAGESEQCLDGGCNRAEAGEAPVSQGNRDTGAVEHLGKDRFYEWGEPAYVRTDHEDVAGCQGRICAGQVQEGIPEGLDLAGCAVACMNLDAAVAAS